MFLALVLAAQDLDALAARLAAEDVEVRVLAEKAILDLPGRRFPETLEALGRRPEPEARALEDRIRVNASWVPLLPGTIREIRARADVVGRPGDPEREETVGRIIDTLSKRPAGEAARLLLPLLRDPAEGARTFALAALRRFPPSDPAPLLGYLPEVRTSGMAAEILVVMGARSAVPRAVDLFVEEGGGTLGAARILEAFGAEGQSERIARAMREKAGLLVWGIRILRATGPDAEAALIALAPDVSHPRRREIAEALSLVGGEASRRLIREIAGDWPEEERADLAWKLGDQEWAGSLARTAKHDIDVARLGRIPASIVRERLGVSRPLPAALLNLLGAVGGAEDLPFLRANGATEAADRIGVPPRPLPALDLQGAPFVPKGRIALTFDLEARRDAIRGLAVRADPDAVATLVRLLDDPAPFPDGTRVWHWAMAGLEHVTGTKTEGASTAAQRAFWRNRPR